MKAITLRDLPEDLANQIETKARRSGKSLNRTVIEMLQQTAPKKREAFHDLDHLAGTWTQEEGEEFGRALEAQRSIDPDLWK